METPENYSSPPTNQQSIISLILGILTVIIFCGGLVPIPFTGFVCFPGSFLLGGFALLFGVISLNRIRRNNEAGHSMAWMGIISGGFVFFCLLCVVIAFASLFIFAPNSIPPILENYQI